MSIYDDVPSEVLVEVDGPVRIVRLNRPDELNATNHALHETITDVIARLDADPEARVAVITGNGRAFSAGGDFEYLEQQHYDVEARRASLVTGRRLVMGLVNLRIPIIAAVNGPAVGLGCSVAALCDVVFMAESAHLADPHVAVGLVAADGGALTWPLLTSLQLAKEYAFTGDRISAQRAAEIGLANHVVPDGETVDRAVELAHRMAKLPRQALQDTKRILNLPLERAVSSAIDFALTAEERSFGSDELRTNVERLRSRQK